MFILVIRTLYGHPKGAMDIFFWVGNHFLSIAKYFEPLINNRKKVKKTHQERNRDESTFVYILWRGNGLSSKII